MNRNFFLGLALIIEAAILTAGGFISYAIDYSNMSDFLAILIIIAVISFIGGLVAFFVPSKDK